MNNEQILLVKNGKGTYIPFNEINDKQLVLLGTREEILERLLISIDEYYDKISPLYFLNEEMLVINIGKKCALCGVDGKIIGNFLVDNIPALDNKLEGDLIPCINNEKCCFIDIKNKKLIETNWLETKCFSDGLCAVLDRESKKWGYINSDLKLVIDYKFDSADNFSEGLASTGILINTDFNLNSKDVLVDEDNKKAILKIIEDTKKSVLLYGYINKEGKVVIPYSYSYADDFKEGYAFTRLYKKDKPYSYSGAYIDKNNKRYEVLEDNPGRFYEGKAYLHLSDVREEPDLFYRITVEDGKMRVKEINVHEYFDEFHPLRDKYGFSQWKQGEYERKYIYTPSKTVLMSSKGIVEIDYYGHVKDMIDKFKSLDGINFICAYDFENDKIVPLNDFIFGSRYNLSEDENKDYEKKLELK